MLLETKNYKAIDQVISDFHRTVKHIENQMERVIEQFEQNAIREVKATLKHKQGGFYPLSRLFFSRNKNENFGKDFQL
jgi:hypothetical protein